MPAPGWPLFSFGVLLLVPGLAHSWLCFVVLEKRVVLVTFSLVADKTEEREKDTWWPFVPGWDLKLSPK